MRTLLRKIGVMMARMRAAVAHVALVAVRGVDGALTWTWQVVNSLSAGPASAIEYDPAESVVEAPVQASSNDLNESVMTRAGEIAVATAQAVVRGRPVPGEASEALEMYILNLHRDDAWVLATADPRTVGRHLAGVEDMKDIVGRVLRRPEPEADRERDVVRRKRVAEEERQRRISQAEHAAALRRERTERVEWEAGLLTPSFSLTP